MCRLVALCLLAWAPCLAIASGDDNAAPPPVSTAELCLMLHAGSTPAEILRDTAARPLLEPLDANAEKLLRDAGADPALVATLRRTHPVATPAQAQAEHARQEAIARQRTESWEANQERLMEDSHAALQATIAARAQEAQGSMSRQLRGKLVVYRDQRMQAYDDDALTNKRQFAFYFAKLSDRACYKFTPQLVKFYAEYTAAHPEFEVVFVSQDVSSMEMETDVRAYPMPWPALAYARLAEEKDLAQAGRSVLPRLLVVDGTGRMTLDSFVDGQYAGPQYVLDALKKRDDADALAKTAAAGH